MKRRTFLALSATSLLYAGCGGGGGSDQRAATVKGIVYDSLQADLPVEGATVKIGSATATTTVRANASATNQVGSFSISAATVGETTAIVTVPGKPAQTIAFQPSITTGANADLALYLNIGQVRGKVVDETGKAVKNAIVVVNTSVRSLTAFTSLDGSFLVELVPDGPADLTAGFGSKLASKSLTVAFGINDAGTLTLVPDPNPNPPAGIKTIFGKVTSATDSTAIIGAPVSLLRNGIQIETTNTDSSGNYFFAVPAGDFVVQILASGYLAAEKPATLTNPNNPLKVDFSLTQR